MGVRLTDAQVVEVREKFAGGVRQVDLATEYGVAQNTRLKLGDGPLAPDCRRSHLQKPRAQADPCGRDRDPR